MIPQQYCQGSDGTPLTKKDYSWWTDLLCAIQYPDQKLTSIIGLFPKDIFYEHSMHKRAIDAIKYGLYAVKCNMFALQVWSSTNKVSFNKNGKVKLTETYIPHSLIVFYKKNIDVAILKFLMYDDRYKNSIVSSDSFYEFWYLDGLTFGYSDKNIKNYYLQATLNTIGIKKYGKDKWYGKENKLWIKNSTKLRNELEKNGELDKFYKRMDKVEKDTKRFIKNTFKSKKFKKYKKEIKPMIVPISEFIPTIRGDNDKDLEKWLNSLIK